MGLVEKEKKGEEVRERREQSMRANLGALGQN